MTVLNTGSNKKFSNAWDKIFGGKKSKDAAKPKASAKKKSSTAGKTKKKAATASPKKKKAKR